MNEKEIGISVITCSINKNRCKQMFNSIKKTIGVPFESIIFDNREKKWGLCKVYNHCAKQAKYPYLCFVHEDIIMVTSNWGKIMVEFSRHTPNCGVIGFAGGTIVKKNFYGWGEYGSNPRYRYHEPITRKEGDNKNYTVQDLGFQYENPHNERFAKVITIDGLFLFVSFETWFKNPFDEKRFPEFHFYDADFSFRISQICQNFVYLQADIYHFSKGTFDKKYDGYAREFQKKWKKRLPSVIGNEKIKKTDEAAAAFYFFHQSRQHGFTLIECVLHIIKINGPFIFFHFLLHKTHLVYRQCKSIIKTGYKIFVPKKIRLILRILRKIDNSI
jgi:hypothetical protein